MNLQTQVGHHPRYQCISFAPCYMLQLSDFPTLRPSLSLRSPPEPKSSLQRWSNCSLAEHLQWFQDVPRAVAVVKEKIINCSHQILHHDALWWTLEMGATKCAQQEQFHWTSCNMRRPLACASRSNLQRESGKNHCRKWKCIEKLQQDVCNSLVLRTNPKKPNDSISQWKTPGTHKLDEVELRCHMTKSHLHA